MSSVANEKVIHDGVLFYRETFFIMTMAVVSYTSYRNIPVIENYDQMNKQQMDTIHTHRESIKRMLDTTNVTAVKLASSTEEMANTTLVFSGNVQSQVASVEEITSAVEEVTASGENMFGIAKKQVDLTERVKSDMENLHNIVTLMGKKN